MGVSFVDGVKVIADLKPIVGLFEKAKTTKDYLAAGAALLDVLVKHKITLEDLQELLALGPLVEDLLK
jgi:hypothetical protein